MIFRAIWPITDETERWTTLLEGATADLPLVVAQAHARITGPGRFSVAHSTDVPGSGRTTPTVLVFEAPATKAKARAYRLAAVP